MKNIKLIMLIFIAAGAVGCNKFLEEKPQGILIGDVAISNVNGLNAQLAGAYSTLIGSWGSGFATAAAIGSSMGGDDVTTHPASNKADFREFDQFNVNSFNGRSSAIWNGCYKSIQSANNIINNYAKATGDENDIMRIVGEAHFIRAFSYYYLVRWWGKIPLITTAVYSPDLLNVPKSEITEVYKLIEEDLKKAEELVGDQKLAPGRINKGVVKAYLADMYLTQSGWPLKDNSKVALAAQYAKDVIDNKAKYGFDLFQGDFLKIFAGGTSENVFALMTDGNATSNLYYGWSGMPGDENGWDDYCSEINFFNSFPEGNRKNGTFLTSVTKSDGTVVQWQNFSIKHPYYKKFRIQIGNPNTYYSSNPIIFMRYAEVLLIYAEAQARSGAPNADAYAAVNAVRNRAGLGDLATGMNSANFVNAVLQERAWEFAAEWHRWFDLVRTETVKQANSNRHANEIPLIGDPGDQTKWFLPIPASEVTSNPSLGK